LKYERSYPKDVGLEEVTTVGHSKEVTGSGKRAGFLPREEAETGPALPGSGASKLL
jgi:hypothetical protein